MDDLMAAYAFCGRIALMQDEGELAEQWLEMAGEQEVRGPMPFLEDFESGELGPFWAVSGTGLHAAGN